MIIMCLIKIHNGKHHEQVGLQCYHQNMEHGPGKMQGQLEPAQQGNYQENNLTGKQVAEKSQRQ